jgi:predicted DNA-binding protein (MmcQ/YjbR family)
VTDYADVPPAILAALRSVCLSLPDASEQQAWAGARWQVRTRTFAHVLTVDSGRPAGGAGSEAGAAADGLVTVMTFRSSGPELDALRRAGHPFFRPGWGNNVVGMVLDTATDWDEVAELVTDSYCLMAPKKLVALVDRPPDPEDADDPV